MTTETPLPTLRWGHRRFTPSPTTIAGYGARLLFAEVMDGGSGALWDRQDSFGDEAVLEDELNPVLQCWYKGARNRWSKWDGGSNAVYSLTEGRVTVRGGPQASHGYLYVTALVDGSDQSILKADPVEHARHAALGENRWFVCGLCDDGGEE